MAATRFIASGFLLMLLGILVLVRGLRKGLLYQRGPHGRIDLRRQPLQFWSGIAVSGLVALFGLAMLIWGILEGLI
jgi:hypothetical protein